MGISCSTLKFGPSPHNELSGCWLELALAVSCCRRVSTRWSRGRVDLTGISRTTPIGSQQRVRDAQRPRATPGRNVIEINAAKVD
jgi:hypothetical protein